MKRIYEKPAAFVESFAANEYVAACYYLACERGSKGMDGKWGKWNQEEFGDTRAKLGEVETNLHNCIHCT